MRNGHYTKTDINWLNVSRSGKICYAEVDGHIVGSNVPRGVIWITKTDSERNHYDHIYLEVREVPEKWRVVAEIVDKKARGRGGTRIGSGRKPFLKESEKKRARSFRLTDAEFFRVQEFIEKMRG